MTGFPTRVFSEMHTCVTVVCMRYMMTIARTAKSMKTMGSKLNKQTSVCEKHAGDFNQNLAIRKKDQLAVKNGTLTKNVQAISTKKGQRPMELTEGAVRRMCFPQGPMCSHSEVARHCKTSPATVSYTRRGMAMAALTAERLQTLSLLRSIEDLPVKPAFFIDKLKWDETQTALQHQL